jgi:hypothetical protein
VNITTGRYEWKNRKRCSECTSVAHVIGLLRWSTAKPPRNTTRTPRHTIVVSSTPSTFDKETDSILLSVVSNFALDLFLRMMTSSDL